VGSGDLELVDLHGGAGGLVAPLLSFRLDPAERGRATERALRAYDRGTEPNPLRVLAEPLPPGGAVAAVLIEHAWAHAVDDAVARMGGTALADAFVAGTELTELVSDLGAAMAAGD
jgi:hypothetical protein